MGQAPAPFRQPDPNEWLTAEAAATCLGRCVLTVYRMAARGEITRFKAGRRTFFSRAEIDAHAAARQPRPVTAGGGEVVVVRAGKAESAPATA